LHTFYIELGLQEKPREMLNEVDGILTLQVWRWWLC